MNTRETLPAEHPDWFRRFCISLAAAVPFLLLQAVFLSDPYGLSIVLFGYGAIFVAIFPVFVIWSVYTFIERRVRSVNNQAAFPAFGVAGAPLLLGFFLPALLIHPIALRVPQFCRVTQAITWPTSRVDGDRAPEHRFILVLIGKGTENRHSHHSGYLNWTGEGAAGFSSIRLQPIAFQYGYYEAYHPGDIELLRARLANASLSDDELQEIAADIWRVLRRAKDGLPIAANTGSVGAVHSHVDNEWDSILGGILWMVIVFVVFQIVGWRTLGQAHPADDNKISVKPRNPQMGN